MKPNLIRTGLAAGCASAWYVALIDADRQVIRQLGRRCSSYAEACARLQWVRHRYPGAVIVRDLLVRDVYE